MTYGVDIKEEEMLSWGHRILETLLRDKSCPQTTDFVNFCVKISIIIDYLRKFYYICIIKLDESVHQQNKYIPNAKRATIR